MSKEAMKLALEALGNSWTEPGNKQYEIEKEAITALREALAEQPAQQDGRCSNALRIQRKAYPRTCKKCGFGPCVALAQQALDKMAENARDLGLDYEPEQEPALLRDAIVANLVREGINKHRARELADHFIGLAALQPAQRTWIGLSDEEKRQLFEREDYQGWLDYINAIEAKLRSKNEDRN